MDCMSMAILVGKLRGLQLMLVLAQQERPALHPVVQAVPVLEAVPAVMAVTEVLLPVAVPGAVAELPEPMETVVLLPAEVVGNVAVQAVMYLIVMRVVVMQEQEAQETQVVLVQLTGHRVTGRPRQR